MNDSFGHRMLEATRLTRSGRLAEATALLQRTLRGVADPEPSDTTGRPTDVPAMPQPPLIDLRPERVELTDPSTSELREDVAGESVAETHLPKSLRGFFKRFIGTPQADALDDAARDRVAEGGRFVTLSYANDAGSRAYKLYIPSRYRGKALPLIVMLHGCTQSPDDFAAGTRMNHLAEAENCFVAYPAQAPSANASKCWNWFSPADQRRGAGEPSLIAGMTRRIMRDHAIDPSRVYVAGLSAGAAAAAVLGSEYPDLYAAIGVHSGLPCGAARDVASAFAAMRQGAATPARRGGAGQAGAQRSIPTIVFHGDRDSTVHPRNGDQVIAQVMTATAGLRTSVERGEVPGGLAYSRTLHVDAGGQAVIEQWVVHGGGHAWSGGSAAGSYTDPRGPDASAEMLRFFLEHRHPPSVE
ncbi:MAG: esterase [Rhodospirillales bacterium]|nr:esterase [Rhodospirillales bacterium]